MTAWPCGSASLCCYAVFCWIWSCARIVKSPPTHADINLKERRLRVLALQMLATPCITQRAQTFQQQIIKDCDEQSQMTLKNDICRGWFCFLGIFLILVSSASQILTGNYQREGLQVFNDSFKAMKYTAKNKSSVQQLVSFFRCFRNK